MRTLSNKALRRGIAASKILSSEARFRMLHFIIQKKGQDVCVKEIAEKIGLTHSATSHQLARLQTEGVVEPSRKGQMMCYYLSSSPLTKQLADIIKNVDIS